jgi:hypothetical protein
MRLFEIGGMGGRRRASGDTKSSANFVHSFCRDRPRPGARSFAPAIQSLPRSQAKTIADTTNLHRKPLAAIRCTAMPRALRSVAMALLDVRPALMQRSMCGRSA